MNIIDQDNLLNKQHEDVLRQYAGRLYPFGRFASIDDILVRLNVDVIIDPRIVQRTVPTFLTDAEEYWEKEIERLKKNDDKESRDALNDARHQLGLIKEEIGMYENMPVRGWYEPDTNVIRLFPNEMIREYNGGRMDELLVSTLFHETMHAYFNRPGHEQFPYIYFVEEPLAEFGMLVFIHRVANCYYNWAYNDVRAKRTCYRYGAELMDEFLSQGGQSIKYSYLLAYKYWLNKQSVYRCPLSGIDVVQSNCKETTCDVCGFFVKRNGYIKQKVIGLKGDMKRPLRQRCNIGNYPININYGCFKNNIVYLADTFRMSDCQNEDKEMLNFCKDIISSGGQLFVSGGNIFCNFLASQLKVAAIFDEINEDWCEWVVDNTNHTFKIGGNWCVKRQSEVVFKEIMCFIESEHLQRQGQEFQFIVDSSSNMSSAVIEWITELFRSHIIK